MKTNYFILSIVFAIVVLAVNQTVNAQSDNFKPYTNKEMKFSIQYPSNWQVEEKEEYPNSVTFQIPDRAYNAGFFMVSVGEPEPQLDTGTMTFKI